MIRKNINNISNFIVNEAAKQSIDSFDKVYSMFLILRFLSALHYCYMFYCK